MAMSASQIRGGSTKYEDLSPEQLEKIAGKSAEEILEIAKSEGIELTDTQLEQVSGGWGDDLKCPKCGSTRVAMTQADPHMPQMVYDCASCGYHW